MSKESAQYVCFTSRILNGFKFLPFIIYAKINPIETVWLRERSVKRSPQRIY